MKKIDWTKPLRYVETKEPAHYENKQNAGYHRVWGRKGTDAHCCDWYNDYGSHDYFPIENVPNEATDQELADKYRELRAEARDINAMMKQRGYQGEFYSENMRIWQDMVRFPDQKFRFTKTISERIIL